MWKGIFNDLVILTISWTGCIVPTSLFASIILIRPVSSWIKFVTESISTVPSVLTGKREAVTPCGLIFFNTFNIAGCSIEDTIICFFLSSVLVHNTWLLASVPPLVKKICSAFAPIESATWFLAFSINDFAFLPWV